MTTANPSNPYKRAEHYDFRAVCAAYMQLSNFPETQLQYRIHDNQIGSLYNGPKQYLADMVRKRLLQDIGITASKQILKIHRALSTWSIDKNPQFLTLSDNWLGMHLAANRKTRHFPEPEFSQELASRLYRACHTSGRGLRAWAIDNHSPFSGQSATSLTDSLKLFLRCALDHATH